MLSYKAILSSYVFYLKSQNIFRLEKGQKETWKKIFFPVLFLLKFYF